MERRDGEPGDGPLALVRVGRGRTAVALAVWAQGRDLLLSVTGGEGHVGAVAVATPPSGTEPAQIVVPGHREGALAREGAARLAAATGRGCAAVVGIHVERATPAEIAEIVANVRAGYEELARRLAPVA